MSRRNVYSQELKNAAVKLLKQGKTAKAVATALGIPKETARSWDRSYKALGKQGFLEASTHRRTYADEIKVKVAKEHVEQGESISVLMKKYQISSPSTVQNWCRLYQAKGESGLTK